MKEVSIPKELSHILVQSDDTLGGRVRFAGTRVPIECLLDALACGRSVDAFVESYPGVERKNVLAFLQWEQDVVRGFLAPRAGS